MAIIGLDIVVAEILSLKENIFRAKELLMKIEDHIIMLEMS